MSASGALIEAAVLPETGHPVTLKRGHLEADGKVAWRTERKAGVAFGGVVYVVDWLQRQASHQDSVDQKFSQARAEAAAKMSPFPTTCDRPRNIPVESELLNLRADLSTLGNGLICDPILVATHPEIQLLDVSVQRIDRLLARLCGGDTATADRERSLPSGLLPD